MTAVYTERDIRHDPNSVITIGTFDGVHLGHRAIIDELLSRARVCRARSVVMTFDPHPREIVHRGPVEYLSTLEERLAVLETTGIDVTLVLKFTHDFSRLSSRDFYDQYVVQKVGVREVVVGHDHMFGKDREAGLEELRKFGKEYGFTAIAVPPVSVDAQTVSSSAIREYLQRGDVEKAQRLLGRPYALRGMVVKGDGRGAGLGFPTANIQPGHINKLVPASGVYFVRANLGTQEMYGMSNIGFRPTFETDHRRVVEVHLFDYHGNLYDQIVEIQFLKRLRSEQKFSSREELITQLQHDRNESMKYLTKMNQH